MDQTDTYQRMAEALRFLAEHRRERPGLETLSRHLGMSPHHLQRTFRRWVGVSPKHFLSVLDLEDAKARLQRTEPVLESALGAGLSSPSRLHDLSTRLVAATPGELRSGGRGLRVSWGWADSPFGACLVATTDRGVCFLGFADGDTAAVESELAAEWPAATRIHDDGVAEGLVRRAFSDRPPELYLRGTPFQIQIWRALLAIPESGVVSYGGLANALGRPSAARAVATAVARNPVSWLIPCHRVIRGTGEFWKYRWGVDRKRAMLSWEGARREV